MKIDVYFQAGELAALDMVERTVVVIDVLRMAEDADRVLVCCFLNLDAVVDAVAGSEELVVVCARRGGTFTAEDALCAGALIRRLCDRHPEMELNDAGSAALELTYRLDPARFSPGRGPDGASSRSACVTTSSTAPSWTGIGWLQRWRIA